MHPKYKTKYLVENWSAYDRALVQRGDITLWLAPEAVATWSAAGVDERGGQRQYSDLAIVGEGEWVAAKHGGRGRRG
jgi:hypothetical protein